MSGVGSIRDVTSERVLSSYALLNVSCLFLWIVSSTPFDNVGTYQRVNIKFCVLLNKYPFEKLRMFEEAYGEVAMKKSRFSSGINVFVMAMRVSTMIRAADDRQRRVTKTSSVCEMLCKMVGRYQRK
jgi:hypothetical protein